MKLFLCLMLLAIQIAQAGAAEEAKPCPDQRSALCDDAEILAKHIREASARIDDIVVRVSVDRWTIIYREISKKPLIDTSPETVTDWASKVQRSWCSLSPIVDFVRRGGEFLYRIENDSGEVKTPTLVLKCQ